MSRKRSAIVALLGLNLLLLAGLFITGFELPKAQAQGRGRPGDYLMATCRIREELDALIMINTQQGGLFVWVPKEASGVVKLVPTGARNLYHDFGR